MSQPLPHRSAVVLSWVDAEPYTPPVRNAVVLRFAPDIPTAIGFRWTSFGTPMAAWPRTVEAHGFVGTTMGGPGSSTAASGWAGGWLAAAFGVGEATYIDPWATTAAAINSTTFGAPGARQVSPALTLGHTTQFGVPNRPSKSEALPQGFMCARFGVPLAYVLPTEAVARKTRAVGFQAVRFGSPQTANYVGSVVPATRFGEASARIKVTVDGPGFLTGGAGQPSALTTVRPHGFGSSGLGSPSVNRAQPAAGFHNTHFGQPGALRSNAYVARSSAPPTRFGRPKAGRITGLQTEGLAPETAFGEPSAMQKYGALHIPPGTRFGRAQRLRSTVC